MKPQTLLALLCLLFLCACHAPGAPTLSSLTATPTVPTKTPPTATLADPTQAPSTPTAVYVPQPAETPVTPLWHNPKSSCDGKPLHLWSLPGKYLYQHTSYGSDNDYLTVDRKLETTDASGVQCLRLVWLNLGDRLPQPPAPGMSQEHYSSCSLDGDIPRGPISITVTGTETLTTVLGTVQALKVDATREYRVFTMNHSDPSGTIAISEWYVCGIGVIRATLSHTGTYQGRRFQKQSRLELSSFTPASTNESHVRYILADIQLGSVVGYYRAHVTDEETAEALRRWDAGVRVANGKRFERRIVHGRWYITYAGTESPIKSMAVVLSSDPKR